MPKDKRKPEPKVEAEPVEKGELQVVREGEKAVAGQEAGAGKPQNIFIGTLNVIAQPLRNVYDPIKKVCYEPLAAHYEGKYRSKFPKHHSKIFVLDMALLAVIGALAVFWFFANTLLPLFPVAPLVRISVLAPKSLVSGESADFVIAYDNNSPKTLHCAELRIRLPEDTVLPEIPPAVEKGTTCVVDRSAGLRLLVDADDPRVHVVPLGDIGPEGRDVIRFKAKAYGPSESTKVMTTELTYWEEAATAPSRVSSRDEWQVTSSALALAIAVPKGVSRGYSQAVAIGYANRGSDVLPNAAVRLSPPEDFVVTGSEPAPTARNEWDLGTIEPGAEGTITVYGYFRATPGPLHAAPTFAVRGYTDTDQGGRVLAELIRENADPGAADIDFSQEIAEPAGRQTIEPGETVRVKIRYRNPGQKTLKDVRVSVDPGAAYINSPSPATLVWDAKSNPELAEVKPGDSGTLEATFAVNEAIGPDDVGEDEPSLHVSSRASYVADDDVTRPVLIDTQAADLPIATKLGLQAAALYYTKDGDQLGVGPLPPKAGQTTKYRVFLTVTTTTGAADGVTVDAYLPPNVEWTGHASVTAGDALDYFPSTGRIRWNINHVPAFADGTGTRVSASFEAAITPTKAEIGSVPPLVRSAAVSGTDATTGLKLRTTAADVTTDLPYDQRAAGKGAVVK